MLAHILDAQRGNSSNGWMRWAERGNRVTVHDVVITLLLVVPWVLVGIPVMGTALQHVRKARPVGRRERSVPPPLQSQRQEMHMSNLPADDARVRQVHDRLRKAA